ncbi:hypothetical protein [Halorientalis halophila]|uniref:hypothetical protein n=1 Tax=Halorientalis halophila TaxID=3108499 RepID=UPI003009674D
MSTNGDDSDQGGAGRREVAYRIFAAEYDDADFSYSESDEERAPNYVVTPSGARVNRLFVVGVLTEVEQVNDDVLRARIVDPTGAFVAYAGQYQPDEMAFLDRTEPPTFVALTGKARTFQPDDADTVYTSVRPESINEVDAETRDRWTVATAEQTLDRVATMAGALGREERGDDLRDALVASGVDEGLAAGTALALDHYGTTPTYLDALRETALDAARVVAGEIDEVDSLVTDPDTEGSVTVADLDGLDVSAAETATQSSETADPEASAPSANVGTGEAESTDDESSATDTDSAVGDADATATDATAASVDDTESEPEPVTGDAGTETPGVETDEEPATTDAGTEPSDSPEPGDTTTESEETDAEPEPVDEADDIGDFEPSGGAAEESGDADDDVGDFDPGEFDLDDEEREEIEEEFGTDFSTGTEVGEPGEADIETPDPEPEATDSDDGAAEPVETESSEAETADPEPAAETVAEESAADAEPDDEAGADEPAEDVDLEDAVMDAMRDLDDGDGADREALLDRVADETGSDPADVEAAVQDALMGGRCYEPDEATLKPI